MQNNLSSNSINGGNDLHTSGGPLRTGISGQLISFVTRYVPRPLMHRLSVGFGWCVAQFLRGHRFVDPIDGFGYSRLLPYGRVVKRSNALAPHSLSLERHRLIWLFLTRELAIEQGSRTILHMAPEKCFLQRLKRLKGCDYVTADLVSPWADVHCDIQALPFDDNRFDLILCNHVLEHIPDDRLAMRELYRVLAPGGCALLQVPIVWERENTLEDPAINTPQLRELHYGQRDHLRYYGRDYVDRLSQAGFDVELRNYAQELNPDERIQFALGEEDTLVIGKKPKI